MFCFPLVSKGVWKSSLVLLVFQWFSSFSYPYDIFHEPRLDLHVSMSLLFVASAAFFASRMNSGLEPTRSVWISSAEGG